MALRPSSLKPLAASMSRTAEASSSWKPAAVAREAKASVSGMSAKSGGVGGGMKVGMKEDEWVGADDWAG